MCTVKRQPHRVSSVEPGASTTHESAKRDAYTARTRREEKIGNVLDIHRLTAPLSRWATARWQPRWLCSKRGARGRRRGGSRWWQRRRRRTRRTSRSGYSWRARRRASWRRLRREKVQDRAARNEVARNESRGTSREERGRSSLELSGSAERSGACTHRVRLCLKLFIARVNFYFKTVEIVNHILFP